MNTILKVKDLKAYYDTPLGNVRAVDGVDLTVKKGEILGIAGESGCGKSTLAKAILRLLKPPGSIHSGEVFFEDKDLLKLDEEKLRKIRWSQLSYIPQSSMNSLNPLMRELLFLIWQVDGFMAGFTSSLPVAIIPTLGCNVTNGLTHPQLANTAIC